MAIVLKNLKDQKNSLRSKMDNKFFNQAKKNKIFVLGICHGAQFLADKLGCNFEKKKHVGNHNIYFLDNEKIINVNSYHNFIIKGFKNKKVKIIACANDKSIEYFNYKKYVGIMWHPERNKKLKVIDKKNFERFTMHLILLAAGMGKRLPKKFRNSPKCMTLLKKKTILENNKKFYEKFPNRTIVTGYKRKKLKSLLKILKLKEVYNDEFKKTNMVHSLFKVRNIKNSNLVICYTDIVFDDSIFNDLIISKNKNVMPLKKNWLDIWKGRMSKKKF